MQRIILYFVSAVIVLILILTIIFWWQIRTPLNSFGEKVIFNVEKGDTAKSVANNLYKSGLIKNPFLFRLYVYFALNQFSLKTGEYELSPAISIRDIADTIVIGGTNEVLITIPEGFNLKQIETKLIEANLAKPGTLAGFRFIKDMPPILSDKPKTASLEGYLFPDTYRFFKDSELSDIVGKMVDNLNNKLTPDLKDTIKKSGHSTYEILTMASLVEKEISEDPNRPIVAGILWKRLKVGIPLQVDATLVYITGRQEIFESDKKINSPYNTYYYRGLPKGPIANPGLSAIKAAIYPQSSSYWYYLSTKDGKIIFSKTLEEHNQNRAKYLK